MMESAMQAKYAGGVTGYATDVPVRPVGAVMAIVLELHNRVSEIEQTESRIRSARNRLRISPPTPIAGGERAEKEPSARSLADELLRLTNRLERFHIELSNDADDLDAAL